VDRVFKTGNQKPIIRIKEVGKHTRGKSA